MTSNLHTLYLFGPLRVLVEDHSGAIVAVQCSTDGASAEGRYRAAYIAQAIAHAQRAHAATHTEG